MKDVVIIGAGLAGLVCAQQLKHSGLNVSIVEKSGGVGGRMATRRLQGTWVDHGAQYITVRSDGFGRFIHKLQEAGIVQQWTRSVHRLTPDGLFPPSADEMYPRYTCPTGMTSIAKHLAADQKVTSNTRIVSANLQDRKWRLTTEDRGQIVADAIVSTMPAPQFLPVFEAVLAPAPAFLKAVKSVKFSPNITIMAGYPKGTPVSTEWKAIRCVDDPILSWVSHDSTKHPQEITQPIFVLQSTREFARKTLEEINLEKAGQPLLNQASQLLATWFSKPEWWQVHRWRYALVEEALGVACLSTEVPLPLVCAGDWCAGSNLEGAYQSGLAAAAALLEMLA